MIIIWMWIKGLVRGRYGSEVSKGLHDGGEMDFIRSLAGIRLGWSTFRVSAVVHRGESSSLSISEVVRRQPTLEWLEMQRKPV